MNSNPNVFGNDVCFDAQVKLNEIGPNIGDGPKCLLKLLGFGQELLAHRIIFPTTENNHNCVIHLISILTRFNIRTHYSW